MGAITNTIRVMFVSALLLFVGAALASAAQDVLVSVIPGENAEILSSIMVDKNLNCLPLGSRCWEYWACCPGTACRNTNSGTLNPVSSTCRWCPGVGDGCGWGWACCPGHSCSGFFSGTCRRG
ncbi:unnamed protein product [Amaranthus hypochondriacus]